MTGKQVRLGRLFRADGRSVVIALDHAQFKGAIDGLTPMSAIVRASFDGGADGVILNPGAARDCAAEIAGRGSLIVRLTGASTDHNPKFDYHRRISTVVQAVALGADAVIAMGFIGGEGEASSLELLAEIAMECAELGMPLIAEMLPADFEHFQDPAWIGLAARAAYELGADIVKGYTTGSDADADAIRRCGVPFLAAGGAKTADPVEIAAQALRHGAAGIAFGRNVFAAPDPRHVVEKLVKTVHRSGPS